MIAQYKESIQEAQISKKNSIFYFKSKGYKKTLTESIPTKVQELLSQSKLKININELSEYLNFSNSDFEDYKMVIETEKLNRIEQEKWGGNFTSQISLENTLFNNYRNVSSYLNQKYLISAFNKNYLPFPLSDKKNNIKVIIKNETGEEVIISNENAIQFSLPWSITYKETTMTSYNPELTEFVKFLIPSDFINYEMLLGGELIYKLIEENIIDKLEYNGY